MSRPDPIVIVGAGHAGVQAAASLREAGVDAPIKLIGAERHLPYERPPLSKRFLQGKAGADEILLRAPAFYQSQDIDLILGDEAVGLARATRKVQLRSGASVGYGHLVFATGSSLKRPSANWPRDACTSLQSLDDAEHLRGKLKSGSEVLVIGAGFIGLEFAAVAAAAGCAVDVVELAQRPLSRSASKVTSAFIAGEFLKQGIRLHMGVSVADVEVDAVSGKRKIELSDGRVLFADIVLAGIGVRANDALAAASGLDCPDGIRVTGTLRTQDENISAIGDCAYYPNLFMGRMARLESVQNASDHARTFAKGFAGEATAFNAIPWFWSDLGSTRLQIAGVLAGCEQFVARGEPESGVFSIFGFENGKLKGVESLNRPADHLLARKLLALPVPPAAGEIADESIPLKALLERSSSVLSAG